MRYKVINESLSDHCCFQFTVVDTSLDEGADDYNVCECFEEGLAIKICDSLNKTDAH